VRSIRPDGIREREIGTSVEGRAIRLASIGAGPTSVLLWSQMHGNEPTHTAVLLDLLSYLQQATDEEDAATILSKCTLHMVPLLNPDGVERWTRRNAQGIDINRDALRLQTPEGQALDAIVRELQPNFAFNLHNQNPRTAVAGTREPAAISLLVPSCDPSEVEQKQMSTAKKVAACLIAAVADRCPGMISRYDADYMPRAFGEAVQRQGAATLLVEAGGWHAPNGQSRERLHFAALHAALLAIATQGYVSSDPARYESLPRSATRRRFDCLVTNATVHNGLGHPPFVADIGINVVHGRQNSGANSDRGTIENPGDLHVYEGKQRVDATGLVCLPGGIAVAPELTLRDLPSAGLLQTALAAGVTTVVGLINLCDPGASEQLARLDLTAQLPVNVVLVGDCRGWTGPPTLDQLEQLLDAFSRGIAAAAVEPTSDRWVRLLTRIGIPVADVPALTTPAALAGCSLPEMAAHSRAAAEELGLVDRGAVRRTYIADLVLFEEPSIESVADDTRTRDLRYVLVNGSVVYENGGVTNDRAGVFL
jgi:hypothetical protein